MGAKIGKSYKSVEDLLRSVFPEHPEMVEAFVKMHEREQIANTLFMLRAQHNVTQEEMARRLGVSQSAIAKTSLSNTLAPLAIERNCGLFLKA